MDTADASRQSRCIADHRQHDSEGISFVSAIERAARHHSAAREVTDLAGRDPCPSNQLAFKIPNSALSRQHSMTNPGQSCRISTGRRVAEPRLILFSQSRVIRAASGIGNMHALIVALAVEAQDDIDGLTFSAHGHIVDAAGCRQTWTRNR